MRFKEWLLQEEASPPVTKDEAMRIYDTGSAYDVARLLIRIINQSKDRNEFQNKVKEFFEGIFNQVTHTLTSQGVEDLLTGTEQGIIANGRKNTKELILAFNQFVEDSKKVFSNYENDGTWSSWKLNDPAKRSKNNKKVHIMISDKNKEKLPKLLEIIKKNTEALFGYKTNPWDTKNWQKFLKPNNEKGHIGNEDMYVDKNHRRDTVVLYLSQMGEETNVMQNELKKAGIPFYEGFDAMKFGGGSQTQNLAVNVWRYAAKKFGDGLNRDLKFYKTGEHFPEFQNSEVNLGNNVELMIYGTRLYIGNKRPFILNQDQLSIIKNNKENETIFYILADSADVKIHGKELVIKDPKTNGKPAPGMPGSDHPAHIRVTKDEIRIPLTDEQIQKISESR